MPPPESGRPLTPAPGRAAPALDRAGGEVADALGASSRRSGRRRPRSQDAAWPRNADRRASSSPGSSAEGLTPSPEADRTTLIRRRDARPDRPAADARGGRRLPRRPLARRLREGRRSPARLAALRRADGGRAGSTRPATPTPTATRPTASAIMWRVARLGDRRLQPQPAVRPVHHRAARRRPAARRRRSTSGSPPASTATTAATPRAGIIPEEYAVEYVVDRVETTATVWLGLTLGCARCHDHKYDPVTQKEFYRLFAFFNNVPGAGQGDEVRQLAAATSRPRPREQQAKLADLDARDRGGRTPVRRTWSRSSPRRRPRGRRSLASTPAIDWTADARPEGALPPRRRHEGRDGRRRAGIVPRTATPDFAPGRIGRGRRLRRQAVRSTPANVGDFGFFDKFSLGAWVRPEDRGGGTIVSRMTDEHARPTATASRSTDGQGPGRTSSSAGSTTRSGVETAASRSSPARWHHVLVTYDGSRVASGVDGLRRRPAASP